MRLFAVLLLCLAQCRPDLRRVETPQQLEAPQPANIVGRVVDEMGMPIADAFITARGESQVLARNEARSGLDGGFVLPLLADNYDFVISASGYQTETLVLRAIGAGEQVDLGTTVLGLTPDETDPTLVSFSVQTIANGLVSSRDVMLSIQGFDNRSGQSALGIAIANTSIDCKNADYDRTFDTCDTASCSATILWTLAEGEDKDRSVSACLKDGAGRFTRAYHSPRLWCSIQRRQAGSLALL
jgi:hypothetical protein